MLPSFSQLLCNIDGVATQSCPGGKSAVAPRPQGLHLPARWASDNVDDSQPMYRDNHSATSRAPGSHCSRGSLPEVLLFSNSSGGGSSVPCGHEQYRERAQFASNSDDLVARMQQLHNTRLTKSESACTCGKWNSCIEETPGENLWRQGQLLGGSHFPATHDLTSIDSGLYLEVPANPRIQHKQSSMHPSALGPATPDGLFFHSLGRMTALRANAAQSSPRDCYCSSCKSRKLNEDKMDDWIAASIEAARYHHHHGPSHHRHVAETYDSPRSYRHSEACPRGSENLRPLNVSLFCQSPSYGCPTDANVSYKRRRMESDLLSAIGSSKFEFQRPNPRMRSTPGSQSSSSISSASVLVDLDAFEPTGAGRYTTQEESEGSSDRKAKVAKYRERRQARRLRTERKGYETRRELASMRTRIKGRFVKESSETWKCSSVENSS